ncbi:MAG: (Fe-S)-binding protein [Ignavibacteriae bacterium]|nr:(Fe-S)-binding protein [Ignavibacteriota bacterium]
MLATEHAVEQIWGVTLDRLYDSEEGRRILSCIQCGTCAGTCPHGEYMEYPARRIITMLKAGLIEDVFNSDSLVKCVNCYACQTKCPRNIRLTEILLPLVKEQSILRLAQMPAELQKAVENTYRYGNPMGESGRKRAQWTRTSPVPVRIFSEDPRPADALWFVESDLSFHPRGQDIARATARVFHAIGADVAILGNEERAAGDCGRLSWEPGLSEALIDYTMSILQKYRFNRIIVSDPHALDAFKYRYPMFGFDYPVESVLGFVAARLDVLAPQLTSPIHKTATYHDSCCLGRHNALFDEPRALLKAIPGLSLVEMAHNRENAVCCGGGGGGMWLDTYYKARNMERLSDRRIREAIATGADVLAIACPYEVSRFEDAVKVAGMDQRMEVRDIMELLVESLGGQ